MRLRPYYSGEYTIILPAVGMIVTAFLGNRVGLTHGLGLTHGGD